MMYRLSVPLSEKERIEWNQFKKEERHISLANMVRSCVRSKMKKDTTSPFEKHFDQIKIMFGSLIERNDKLREWMDFLDMRLNVKEGNTELKYEAGREINKILVNEESDLSSLLQKIKKYDRETINTAIIELSKYGVLDSYRKREEKNETEK